METLVLIGSEQIMSIFLIIRTNPHKNQFDSNFPILLQQLITQEEFNRVIQQGNGFLRKQKRIATIFGIFVIISLIFKILIVAGGTLGLKYITHANNLN